MISKSELISTLTRFVREYGRYPSKKECRDIDWLYGWNTYWRVLGRQSSLTILEDVYNENPKLCANCNSPIQYKKRNNKFCGHSCSASYNNKNGSRAKRLNKEGLEIRKCLHCEAELKNKQAIFCSIKCQADHRFKNNLENWLATGVYHENRVIRQFLICLDGNKCSVCGIESWNNKPIVFEVEHINGDSEDSSRENVCLICPNCHSQTSTYKGKNKGRGRFKRSQRYRDGKSY